VIDREGIANFKLVGDFLFLNDARLRLDLSDYVAFSYVTGLLHKHDVGEIEFESGLAREDLAPLVHVLLQDAGPEDVTFQRFHERLAATPARHMRIEPFKGAAADRRWEQDDAAKRAAKLTYFQSVYVAKEMLTDMRLGRAVNLRRVKRAVQSIVDQVLNNETSMIGMTTLRDYDEYTFTHSVNVCIFSVVVGQKLGLSKIQLYELGLGALFHDIGKQRIDPAITNKPGGLTEDEWHQMQQHPTEGLLSLFSMRGLSEVPYRPMLQAYEHHMKTDLSGYPKNHRPRHPTLFSRIVNTVDGFDAATSKRSYQNQPWPADEVLREMRENPARGHDAILVKAFINVTGVFPVGTLCILDTQELAVVVGRNPDPTRVHQPIVKIVSNEKGMMLPEPITVDLGERDPATGRLVRMILKTTDPERYGIRVSDYFI
ncbi:MAG TPA: HD domain-containing phosphohydrolase, partial [Longimicrobiales bacterium]|nr:HD domain-containing phosphohydrolase [Longimicrobiales bacterium]